MVEKILPKRYANQNCIENCIANICDALDLDFRPIFLFSWDFGYDLSKPKVGERVHYRNSCDMGLNNYLYVAKKYLNIDFSCIPDEKKNITDLLNKGVCLLISIDSFECPWNLAYQKYHYPHFYILKYSDTTGFIAIDSFSSSEPVKVNIDTLNKSKEVYKVDFITADIQNIHSNVFYEFSTALKNNNEFGIFELINKFSFELTQINSIYDLASNLTDFSDEHLIRRMRYIANSRYNTNSFFEYLDLTHSYIEAMQCIYEKWEALKNFFIKVLISKNLKFLPQASSELIKILNLEKELCNVILRQGAYCNDSCK